MENDLDTPLYQDARRTLVHLSTLTPRTQTHQKGQQTISGSLIAAYPNDGDAVYTAIVIIFVPFAVAAYSAYFENPGKAILRGIATFFVTGGISLAFFPIIWFLTL